MKKICLIIALYATFLFVLSGCGFTSTSSGSEASVKSEIYAQDLASVPPFTNSPYAVINNNQPYFEESEKTTKSFERYAELDSLGRCGVTYACIGIDIMPTEERGEIGMVKPTGWHSVKYDCVDGKHLYNRCHLIGFQLAGENANKQNLITGTRYLNVDGMLPFENMVADYVKETKNHVLYRVTPIFEGNNLVANGVLMEAFSVEDNGEGICFNVYCYNNQPQVTIDYATGESWLTADDRPANSQNSSSSAGNSTINSTSEQTSTSVSAQLITYVLNTNTKKFHLPTCSSAISMNSANRKEMTCTRDELISGGYSACKSCNP